MENLTDLQKMKLNNELAGRNCSRESAEKILEGISELIKVTGRGIDDGTFESPYRIFKAYLELTKGYTENPATHLLKTFDIDKNDNEVVIIKDIDFNSLCEHHAMPFFGKVHIAYIPNGKVVGLSKFARLVEGFSKRLQLQERLTSQIITAIDEVLAPAGVMVVIEAEHTCMTLRGIKNKGALTTTVATRGIFNESNKKKEILNLLK